MTPSPNSTVTRWTDDWDRISARLSAPPRILVACDFDGTLAGIAANPDSVQLSAVAAAVLEALLSAPGVSLAVISGRSIQDLRARVPAANITLSGNHGLEIEGLGLDSQRQEGRKVRPVLQTMAEQLADALGGVPGIRIEDKGLSLSIHTRNVIESHRELVIRHVTESVSAETSLRLQAGKEVLEILPAAPWDKGCALRQIAGRLGIPLTAAVYIGDDTTDEAAFAAVEQGTGIRVGPAGPTMARWAAHDPEDVWRFLEELARARAGIRCLASRGRPSQADSTPPALKDLRHV